MNQHIFFQEFGNRPPQPTVTKEHQMYIYNCMILEISNNWEAVRELMYQYRNQLLEKVDALSNEWISFILQNNIDIIKYGDDSEKFVNENIK